jgi:hypothetical protein
VVTTLGKVLGTTLGTTLEDFTKAQWKAIAYAPTFDATKVYALSFPAGAGAYATPAGGGEAGVASGFGHILLYAFGPPTATERVLGRFVSGGYTLDRSGTAHSATWWAFDGGGTQRSIAAPYPTNLATEGLIAPIILRHTGSAIDAQYIHTSQARPSLAITGYTPPPGTALTAASQSAANASRNGLMSVLSYRGTPSDSQLQAVLDAMRTLGDVPTKAAAEALMPGTTVTHRWSLRDTLAAANVPVADGVAAPATIPDSVTSASIDAMTKTGSPVVRVVDPSAYPRTTYGILGTSDTSYLETAVGIRGSASTGLTLIVVFRPDAAASGSVVLVSNYNTTGPKGFTLYTVSSAVRIYRAGSGDLTVGTAAAMDAMVPKMVAVTWDGTTWTPYDNGVAGTPSVATLLPSDTTFRVGAYPTTTGSGAGVSTQYAIAGCDQALSAAEIAAVYSTWRATGVVQLPAGKLNPHHYDLTQDIIANGGPSAGVPAQVLDRVGTDHLTRVGTGLQVSQRTERLWSYETTPILYGASALDMSNYYDCPTALGEGSSSFWAAMMFTVTSQAVASKARVPFASASAAPSNISGFSMNTSGTNTLCSTTFYNGLGGGVSGPTGVIAPADIGKILLLVSVLDAPAGKVRTYWKRAESGTGTNYTAYVASTAGMRIGRTYLATDYTPDGIQVWGVAAGIGLPSLAQVQAMFDQTQASERIGSIAGMTSLRVDLTQDALGNAAALPASLVDRQSGTYNFTRTGAVSTATTHARAFGW